MPVRLRISVGRPLLLRPAPGCLPSLRLGEAVPACMLIFLTGASASRTVSASRVRLRRVSHANSAVLSAHDRSLRMFERCPGGCQASARR